MYLEQKHFKSALVAVEPVIEAHARRARTFSSSQGTRASELGQKDKAIAYYKAALTYSQTSWTRERV